MKTTVTYQPRYLPRRPLNLPGGMTRRAFLGKVLDLLLVAASGMGIAGIVLISSSYSPGKEQQDP